MTFEVTVEPEDTSDVDERGNPDQNHATSGLGRPEKNMIIRFRCNVNSAVLRLKKNQWFLRFRRIVMKMTRPGGSF
jgi:hypothetical protein